MLQNYEFICQKSNVEYKFLISDISDQFVEIIDRKVINFFSYTDEDVKNFLVESGVTLNGVRNLEEKISTINAICNSNLDLIKFLSEDILNQNLGFSKSLSQIIDHRLSILKTNGKQKSIDQKDMEEIILTASLSWKSFSHLMISQIVERSEEVVNDSFYIASQERFLKKNEIEIYDFLSSEVKSQLAERMITEHKSRLLDFYNYLSENKQDEYYYRAYYLLKYYGKLESDAFTLLILALSKAFTFYDQNMINTIIETINKYSVLRGADNNFDKILNIYKAHYSGDIENVEHLFDELTLLEYDDVLSAELCRLRFRVLYMNINDNSYNKIVKILLPRLRHFSMDSLNIISKSDVIITDEIVLRLRILCEITPFVLDYTGDRQQFFDMYKEIKKLLKITKKDYRSKESAEFIENIYNRKAFLFSNPMECGIYYDEAKRYFLLHQIWDEYAITLVCEAGTNIVISDYEQAIQGCQEALKVCKDKKIELPQIEKLFNNLIIAGFFNQEKTVSSSEELNLLVKSTIDKLTSNLKGIATTSEFVIMTNICSLQLYINEIGAYNSTKKLLEQLMECDNIANIDNDKVNDFYRYYFAWFEIYISINNCNWDQCRYLIEKIDGFVPALFSEQEEYWIKKNNAVKQLIEGRKLISAYDFCNNLVNENRRERGMSKFFYRGLMLSDLQYTSYT
jgi:hypothetical protein